MELRLIITYEMTLADGFKGRMREGVFNDRPWEDRTVTVCFNHAVLGTLVGNEIKPTVTSADDYTYVGKCDICEAHSEAFSDDANMRIEAMLKRRKLR